MKMVSTRLTQNIPRLNVALDEFVTRIVADPLLRLVSHNLGQLIEQVRQIRISFGRDDGQTQLLLRHNSL